MEKFKQKLLLRHSSGREVNVNKHRDSNANPAGVRGTTYSGSTLMGGQASEESGPWGLKQLFPGVDPTLDIVAVHGLNGHREKTWTYSNESGGDDIMWLRDLLPKKIPRARVWTWGYDSRTHTRSHREHLTTKKLYDHGRELVFDLDGARRESDSHQRPIIFIAHSLGGIVVKNALLHSDRVKEGKLEDQRSIKLSTYGVIFMGTPHQGGQGVGIGKILVNIAKVQGDANDSLLKHLEEHSELLQQQNSEFSLISQSFDIKFAYETKPTPLAGVIVPKWSAVLSGMPDAAEFGINADHRSMTKFSSADNEDFQKLSRTLEFMLPKSGPKIEANWAAEAQIRQAAVLNSSKNSRRMFLVPFERDLKFVGRMDIIAKLNQRFNSHRRVALAGIGGVGKSQIAIEYCYIFRDKHPDASIFWVHVGSVSKFKQGYEAIADNLGLVKQDDPKADTLKLVAAWLNNEDNGNWLLILDGADDQTVFESRSEDSEQSTSLVRYLPSRTRKGSIIITTRDKRVGERLAFREEPLMVPSFDEHMAKTLLRSKLNQNIELIEEDADNLVETLDFLPLAITQAAAFITENNITTKKYIEILRASDSGLTKLLNQDLIDLRRDFDASSSVIRTWQVSFDQIRDQAPRAAELLSLMAVLDRQGIPKALLSRDDEDEIDIITILGTLQAFSLISSDKEREIFEMHRLVQLSTLKWLDMQNTKLNWQNEALRLLSANFPCEIRFETWKICALYLPHVMIVVDRLKLGPDHVNELGLLVETASYLSDSQGQYRLAEQFVRQALELYKKAFGDEHFDTLKSMRTLGQILYNQGKYNDAEGLLRKVLILSKRILGNKHGFTLSSVHPLTNVLTRQGKYEEAKEMLEQNVKLHSELMGEEHKNTLADMENLAETYGYLQQFGKAEKLGLEAMEKRQRVLGAAYPHTLLYMNNLSLTYHVLNRLGEAEELEVQALEKCEKEIGAEHPHTLLGMVSLGSTYLDLNRLDDAREHVLEKREKGLGAEHPDTLWSMASLGSTYYALNRLDEAEELEVQVLEKREKVLGAEHPYTLLSMSNLATTYFSLNRLDEAAELQVQALEKREKVLGAEHPDTLWSMASLGWTYRSLNRLDEAKELGVQALEKREKVLGAEHADTLWSLAALGSTYHALNRLGEAEELQVQALEKYTKVLGAEHPHTLSSMSNLAWTWNQQGHIEKAIPLMSDAVRLSETVLGADDQYFKDRQQWLNEWREKSLQKAVKETEET